MRARMTSRRVVVLALVALVASCQTPGSIPEDPADIVVGHFEGVPVTLAEAMEVYEGGHQGHKVLVQEEKQIRELTARVLERRAYLAEAESLGIAELPELEEARVLFLRKRAAEEYWKRTVDDLAKVSDEEVERFYERNQFRYRLLLMASAEKDSCQGLKDRVVAGEEFADVAAEASTHASKDFGGDAGWTSEGDMDPALEPIVREMEVGAMTPVVQTSDGWVFARLEEKVENTGRSPPEVAYPQIRVVLEEQLKESMREEVTQRILAEAQAVVEEDWLTKARLLSEDDADRVVAQVGAETITLGELRENLDLDAIAASDPARVKEGITRYLWDWGESMAAQVVADRAGLTEDPGLLKEAAQFREDAIMSILMEQYVMAGTEPSEAEVQEYYEANLTTLYTAQAQRKLSQIVLKTKAEAEDVLRRLSEGEDFGKLSAELSLARVAAMHGGSVGWIGKNDILEELEEPVFALAVGEIGGPFESSEGFHVVHVRELRDEAIVPFFQARSSALTNLRQQRQREARANWSARLAERARAGIDDEGVRVAAVWLQRDFQAVEEKVQEAKEAQGADAQAQEAVVVDKEAQEGSVE